VKLLAEKTGVSEEAVRGKLEQGEVEAGSREAGPAAGGIPLRAREARRGSGSPPLASPAPPEASSARAKVRVETKLTARDKLEQLVLALALAHPLTRLSLEDLQERSFSTPERRQILRVLLANREMSAEQITAVAPELAQAINILLLVCENESEYREASSLELSQKAFEQARRLQLDSNHEYRKELIGQLREAEQAGDAGLVHDITLQIQVLNAEEI